ncbi:MAG: hypothetical protein M1270_01920 [Gammaproteobacteria bacterium]|nr:hypothetical protein [Gammaproteobacteria bacterium]
MKQLNTDFWLAIISLLEKISDMIGEIELPISAVITGNAAYHYHTLLGSPEKLDICFDRGVILPPDLKVKYFSNGIERSLTINRKYNEINEFVFPETMDAIDLGLIGPNKNISLKVISAIDVAVSRLSDTGPDDTRNDDILKLSNIGSFNREEFQQHAEWALSQYFGDTTRFHIRLHDACSTMTTLSGR